MGRSALGRLRAKAQSLDRHGYTTFATEVDVSTTTQVMQWGIAGQSLQQNHRKGSYTVPTGMLLKWQSHENDFSNTLRLMVVSPKSQSTSDAQVFIWNTWANKAVTLGADPGIMSEVQTKYTRTHLDRYETVQTPSARYDGVGGYVPWYSKVRTAYIRFPPMLQKFSNAGDAWPNSNSIWIAVISDSALQGHPRLNIWGRLYFDT
jgi:hypothetical protein